MRIKAFVAALAFFVISENVPAQKTKNTAQNNGLDRPKLVIGIVVDQMRWDYLYRYYNKYSEGGFKRLLKKGFGFENTMIPYTPCVTAAGHTCLYTGSVPAVHGIVGNDWVDPDTGDTMYCSQDKTVQTVGSFSNQGQMSPRNMLTTTVGDELRLATNFKSRVYGISLKDRGGIFMAGHSANAAYWFDDSTGNWITGTYYMNALPQWVQQFNAEKRPDAFMRSPWIPMYDTSVYDQSTSDNKPYERPLPGETKTTFPHSYSSSGGKNYFPFRISPFGNTFTLDFAKQLIAKEKLGSSGQTDMLCISLSSTDYIGHRFGPQSIETEDTYLRLDKELSSFITMLDNTIGENEYVLFLSSDHGAPQTPHFMKETKFPGGNLSGLGLLRELNIELAAKYKVPDLLHKYYEYQFWFNKKKIDSAAINENELHEYVVHLLLNRKEIVNAFSYKNFDKVILPLFIKEHLTNGYFPKRSGDIQFLLKPQYTDGPGTGTDHGVWYSYDAHIPLLFYGRNIKPGKTYRETYMTDVASTLSAILHIQIPSGAIGKVLEEVVK